MPIRRRLGHDNLTAQENVVLNISFFTFVFFFKKKTS